MKNGYLQDFADGFLSAADFISVFRHDAKRGDLRRWDYFRDNSSPGVRAVASYSLRNRERAKGGEEELYVNFGSDGFMMGQGIGTTVSLISLGALPAGMWLWSEVERGYEPRMRKHFQNLLREIHSV